MLTQLIYTYKMWSVNNACYVRLVNEIRYDKTLPIPFLGTCV